MKGIKIEGYEYNDMNTAKRCQEWCKKHKSCDLEIKNYATNKKEVKDNGKTKFRENR